MQTNKEPRYALTYGAVLAPGDDPAEYEKHVQAYYNQYQPQAEHEIFFTQEMADAVWRLRKARKLEAQATTIEQLERIGRYIATIERTYQRACKEIQSRKIQNEPKTQLRIPYPAKTPNDASLRFMLNEFARDQQRRPAT